MIKFFFKVFFFAGAVLLLGQLEVGNRTIASHFQGLVQEAVKAAQRKFSSEIAKTRVATSQVTQEAEEDIVIENDADNEGDDVSPADREKLMRLLQ